MNAEVCPPKRADRRERGGPGINNSSLPQHVHHPGGLRGDSAAQGAVVEVVVVVVSQWS